MSETPMVQHPGTTEAARVSALPCRAVHRRVTLPAGATLFEAMTEAADGAGAWFDLTDLPVEKLTFVRPATSPDDRHVAWYSAETELRDAVIERAGAHLGRRNGAAFAHIHGMWRAEDGACHAGHLLAEKAVLSKDHTVDVWLLEGAMLETAPNAETEFTLFRPVATGQVDNPNAVLGVIRPNEVIEDGIEKCAAVFGSSVSAVKGLGSFVGTQLQGQPALMDIATEVLLFGENGRCAISVGLKGSPVRGELTARANRVCVTFEVLLLSQAE
ncbi:hypothetical protein ACGYK3_18015 [Sulfitobacter sp. 1A05707]|uniref:hypothetical protein n=1 Tax=Sulfitobacter sp. 1A05707 TaxID=3368560 RepID=UPI0037473FE4